VEKKTSKTLVGSKLEITGGERAGRWVLRGGSGKENRQATRVSCTPRQKGGVCFFGESVRRQTTQQSAHGGGGFVIDRGKELIDNRYKEPQYNTGRDKRVVGERGMGRIRVRRGMGVGFLSWGEGEKKKTTKK